MCHERERLIGYVYDECDHEDRRLIEAHLEECGACRAEIAGFRDVRQDLLAWEVPERESVWRPFAQPRPSPWWRDVPAWAMAAAALAVFAVGAGGGVVTHALVAHDDEPVATAASSTGVAPGAALTPADLAAFEARMLGLVREELADRAAGPGMQRVSMTADERSRLEADILARVSALQEQALMRQDQNWGVLAYEFGLQTARVNKLGEQVEGLVQVVGLQGR